jgi:hypothetical protein
VLLYWLGHNVYVPVNNDGQQVYGVSNADLACTAEALNLALVVSSVPTQAVVAGTAAFGVASGAQSR